MELKGRFWEANTSSVNSIVFPKVPDCFVVMNKNSMSPNSSGSLTAKAGRAFWPDRPVNGNGSLKTLPLYFIPNVFIGRPQDFLGKAAFLLKAHIMKRFVFCFSFYGHDDHFKPIPHPLRSPDMQITILCNILNYSYGLHIKPPS